MLRSITCVYVLVVLMLARPTDAGIPLSCGPDAGDCCLGNRSPGCDDQDCCAIVCACDPFCCDVVWDEDCATSGEGGSGCGAGVLCGLCADSDGDGVSDNLDVCCDTQAGVTVDAWGRPLGDLDLDCDVDLDDFALFQQNLRGVSDALGPCCVPGPGVCYDGNLCTNDTCIAGRCVYTDVVCPQGEQCFPDTGACREIQCVDDADCNDGLACTEDICVAWTCEYTLIDARCEDGLFCTGDETCEPDNEDADADGCISSGNPCSGVRPVCNEGNDECDACASDADCDDGITCTLDTCEVEGSCMNVPHDAVCDDDLYCTDDDFCDPANEDANAAGCVNETDPCEVGPGVRKVCNEATDECDDCTSNSDCDDGVACTNDTCNGVSGECMSTPNNDNCEGADICDATVGCVPAP